MELQKMTKKEFFIGISIITLVIIIGSILHFITINTTEEITTKVKEVIHCTTDENGVVECQN